MEIKRINQEGDDDLASTALFQPAALARFLGNRKCAAAACLFLFSLIFLHISRYFATLPLSITEKQSYSLPPPPQLRTTTTYTPPLFVSTMSAAAAGLTHFRAQSSQATSGLIG